VTSEPYILEHEQNTPVGYFLNADLGYNPYVVLYATERTVKQRPDLVRSVVQSTQKGWGYYFQHTGDVNGAIAKRNRDMTGELMSYSAGAEKPLVYGKDNALGQLTTERWQTLLGQLEEIGALKHGQVTPSSCFTAQFVSKSPS
jgi:NitT/TauT family transport system substrate-binding protein